MFIAAALGAQAAEISNLKAGTLSEAGIASDETVLKVSGTINAADFAYIIDNLYKLQTLDLSQASISAYSGAGLPYTGVTKSAADVLPNYALTGLSHLSTLKLPARLTAIGNGALSGTGITELIIPAGVTTIGDYAAMRCNELTTLTIPESVSSIGTRAFANCPKLATVTVAGTVEQLPDGVFEACGGIKSLNLEKLANCTEIGQWALAECNGITALVLPPNSEAMEQGALYGTASISAIELPANIDYLGTNAMSAMTALKTIDATGLNLVPALGDSVWSRTAQPDITLNVPADLYTQFKNASQWKEFHIPNNASIIQSIESNGTDAALKVTVSGSELAVDGGDMELGDVALFDAAGRRVAHVASEGTEASINIDGFAHGVYLLVTSNAGTAKIAI